MTPRNWDGYLIGDVSILEIEVVVSVVRCRTVMTSCRRRHCVFFVCLFAFVKDFFFVVLEKGEKGRRENEKIINV